MTILLLGAGGQLGAELRDALQSVGEVVALGRQDLDVTDPEATQRTVRGLRPQAIVNAAAYTAVDRAETEREAAHAVNAAACETLARAAQGAGAWLVHFSTDYVFDGSGTRPWGEDDPPAPLNAYGATKLAGEAAVRSLCERHLVLRTSWVYEAGRDNFIATILGAARARDSLAVVHDQWGSPTRARTIAQATAHVLRGIEPRHAGLYHFAAAGVASRLELARYALMCAQREGWALRAGPDHVRPARTADMPSPARRPLNSRLDCALFDRTFGFPRPSWQDDVAAAIGAWPPMTGG